MARWCLAFVHSLDFIVWRADSLITWQEEEEGSGLKKNYKAVAFSGPTIWGHLDARLVAD